jgi:hypothetical protein
MMRQTKTRKLNLQRVLSFVTVMTFLCSYIMITMVESSKLSYAIQLENPKTIRLDLSNEFGTSDIKPDGLMDSIFDNLTIGNQSGETDLGVILSDGSENMKPYLWIPNAQDNSVSKINTETGAEVGRYKVSGGDGSPSRTTVDLYGNCWVINRGTGTAVKIGNVDEGIPGISYLDRNQNGIIDTSQPKADGTATVLPWGQDEAILFEVKLFSSSKDPGAATYTYRDNLNQNQQYDNYQNDIRPRGIAVDRDNNAWVATWAPQTMYYINGLDGTVLASFDAGHSSYGMFLDGGDPDYDYLWSTVGAGGNHVYRFKIDRKRLLDGRSNYIVEKRRFDHFTQYPYNTNPLYTIVLDKISDPNHADLQRDIVYNSARYSGDNSHRIFRALLQESHESNVYQALGLPVPGNSWGRGVQADRFGSVWHAVSGSHNILRIRYDARTSAQNPHGRLLLEQNIDVRDMLAKFLRRNNNDVPVDLPAAWSQPMGMSLDQEGNVWVVLHTDYKIKIRPSGSGNVNLSMSRTPHPTQYNAQIDIFKGNSNGIQYAYSDMTGAVTNQFNASDGRWTVIIDGKDPNAIFEGIKLRRELHGGKLEFEVRTSQDRVNWSAPISFTNQVGEKALIEYYRTKQLPKGRYFMVTTTFRRANVMTPSPSIEYMEIIQGVPVQQITPEKILVDEHYLNVLEGEIVIQYNPEAPSLKGLTWKVVEQLEQGVVEIIDTDQINVKKFKVNKEEFDRSFFTVEVTSDDYDVITGRHYFTFFYVNVRMDVN